MAVRTHTLATSKHLHIIQTTCIQVAPFKWNFLVSSFHLKIFVHIDAYEALDSAGSEH